MGRSQETFNKKEVRSKKEKKRKDKEQKRIDKKDNESSTFEEMLMYVDENGNLTPTPPDPTKKKAVRLKDIEISVARRDDSAEDDSVRKGVVTFFNPDKGFGFIKDSESGESVFVHINNAFKEIKENNMVSFEVEKGQKGPTAVNVKPNN